MDPCIVFEDVRKTFTLRHGKFFKEAVIAALTRKNHSTKFNAVDDLSFEVYPGEAVAVLGRNGSGKSTTLKLLSGVLRPDAGWIGTQGRVAGLLEVGAGFHPDLTGRDNVYLNAAILGMSKQETDERFDEIVEFAEIGEFIDTEVKRYSSGMYSRLGFAVAVHTELDVLLVDEVLSVGDAQFREKCNAKMKELQQQGKTMFIVSHAAAQVKQLCQRGIVLDHGKKVFDGPIAEAVELLNPKQKPKPKPKPKEDSEELTAKAKTNVKPKNESKSKPEVSSTPGVAPHAPDHLPGTQSPAPAGVIATPVSRSAKLPSTEPVPDRTANRTQREDISSEAGLAQATAVGSAATVKSPSGVDQAPPDGRKSGVTTLNSTDSELTGKSVPGSGAHPASDASESAADSLQARLSAMNRLKDREYAKEEVPPSAGANSATRGRGRVQEPKHGA